MPLLARLKRIYGQLGFPGAAFLVCLAFALLPWSVSPFFQLLAVVFGFWWGLRLIRKLMEKAIWRLRNRLLVTYTFIAVVPLLLIVVLAGVCAYALMSQFTVHLLTTEMNRRIESLSSAADSLKVMDRTRRAEAVERMVDVFFRDRFQGIQVVVRQGGEIARYPNDLSVTPPSDQWDDATGLLEREGHLYGWAHRNTSDGSITVAAPFSPEYLASLLPELGLVQVAGIPGDSNEQATSGSAQPGQKATKRKGFLLGKREVYDEKPVPASRIPSSVNVFDIPLTWFASRPIDRWEAPKKAGEKREEAFFQVQSRPSRVFALLFSRTEGSLQNFWPIGLTVVSILFLIVEVIALFIGVSMTRTMTGAVNRLHEGTQRVMQGDFTHRIAVKGHDQLAELGHSFNLMTENVERLLAVAKEKERLQSEIEIAREVQNQLYPKLGQEVQALQVKAGCRPARLVSGDYYDYGPVKDHHVALAIGDVAGKGISAALLMATLQSAFRTHMTNFESPECTTAFSTAGLVTQLNLHLCKNTSPEKFSTFFLGLYDASNGLLTYTNAGHLPPILFRNGETRMLEIDGTVVGAFPFAAYGQSSVVLNPGDLILCYTDGITEPENAYGEMYGDDRLIQTVHRNLHKSDDQIIEAIMESVLNWTGSPELQDDMTILLARRE